MAEPIERKFKKAWLAAIAILLCLFFAASSVLAERGRSLGEPELIFIRADTVIEQEGRVERLMAVGSDITVRGTVEKGAVIVDGNLALTATARVSGPVVVLGGNVSWEQGAQAEKAVLVLARGKTPFASILIASFFLLVLLGAVALPVALWLTVALVKKHSFYWQAENWFLKIRRRWPALYVIVALGISAFMMTLFIELAWETLFRQQMETIDNVFIWLVRYFANPCLDRVMVALSDIGSGYSFVLITAIAFLVLGYYRRWPETGSLALCLGGAVLLNILLKHLFERSRPEAFRLVEAAGYSFPSGHAMVSLCFYGMLAFLVARQLSSWCWRLTIFVAVVSLVTAIGVSRIYLGVHYPSDVAAGYAAGAMWLAFSVSLLFIQEQ